MKNIERIQECFSEIKDRLDEIAALMMGESVAPVEETPAPSELVQIADGNTAPWIEKAREYFGKDEKDHHTELSKLMDGIDPEKDPWCAYFVNAVLRECGLPFNSSGLAADYENYGNPCEKKNGAIAVFDGHVGFVVNDTKILGGNQGDMVKENNLAWYEQNKKLLGYRCPEGFELG